MKNAIILIIGLFLSGCLSEDPLNQTFHSIQPREIGDDLILSAPSLENMDSMTLLNTYNRVYNEDNLWSMRSLLVFRNGRLVSEAYIKEEKDISNRHIIWSTTKQVMGILVGIAIDQGFIESLDDPISRYLKDELKDHPDKAEITIRQLITMESGIDYSNDGDAGETDKVLRQLPDNITEFVLSLPLKSTPGTEFFYKDSDPQLLSAIIQKLTGKPTDEWADEVFFSKIRVQNYNWVRYKDGTTLGGFGIETTPRELAKIALCVADNGKWNNNQVIPAQWVAEMTTPQVQASSDYSFGYQWWIDPSRNTHFMWGAGGQYAFINPAKNLVIVMTALPNTSGKYQLLIEDAWSLVDEILDASL